MKVVIQRVSRADVTIDHRENHAIGQGLVVLLGVMQGDGKEQAEFLAKKVAELRIFNDEQEKMNRSLLDIQGEALVVSNFTLSADCKKGRRPAFTAAAAPEQANALYEYFLECLRQQPLKSVQTGKFGAHMDLTLTNDGPITILIDTAEIGK